MKLLSPTAVILSSVLAASTAWVACGDDSSTTTTGAAGSTAAGTAGTGGSAGGTTGTAGTAGTGGTGGTGGTSGDGGTDGGLRSAKAEVKAPDTVTGTVTFNELPNDALDVVVKLSGFTAGPDAGAAGEYKRGLHVHQNGECSHPDHLDAGGHLNPEGNMHACPPTEKRHLGDLGNVPVKDGLVDTTIHLTGVKFDDIVGKALIVHAGEDDCTSQPVGNSGARVGCALIKQ